MKFIIIDKFNKPEHRNHIDIALRSNGYKCVFCWIDNQQNKSEFHSLAAHLKDDIWDGLVILQRVLVTKIKTDSETEIFQRDLEDSQINILLEYYKQRLKDEFVEIVDLR